MKKKLLTMTIMALLLIFASCERNKNEVNIEEKAGKETVVISKYNEDLKNFALAVSKAMNASPEFRKFIKEEANLKFDGDYDIVIKRVMNKPITAPANLSNSSVSKVKNANFSVGDLLGEFMPETTRGSSAGTTMQKVNTSPSDVITALTEQYPNLQVAIPVNIENWDETVVQTVTFIPEEFKDGETKKVIGYSANGNTVEIDAINPPEKEPIIVIGMNERIINEPLIPLEPIEDIVVPTPTSLAAKLTESGVQLSWNMPTGTNFSNTSGFRIFRKKGTELEYTPIATVLGHSNREFTDQTITNNVTCRYYVVAFYDYIFSDVSNYITVQIARPNAATSFTVEQETLNQVKLFWTYAPNEYDGNVNFYKRIIGSTYSSQPFDSKPTTDDESYDNNVLPGQKIEYKIMRATAVGLSIPKYDFIYTPYRDMSRDSKVIIKRVKFSNIGKIESWLRGAPDFFVKVLKSKDGVTSVIEPGLRIDMKSGTDNDEWSEVSIDQGMVTRYWNPGKSNWFDTFSFYFIENDNNNFMDWKTVTLIASEVKKILPDTTSNTIKTSLDAVKVIGTVLEKWCGEEDEEIGYAHLYYYDNPNRIYETSCSKGKLTIQFGDTE